MSAMWLLKGLERGSWPNHPQLAWAHILCLYCPNSRAKHRGGGRSRGELGAAGGGGDDDDDSIARRVRLFMLISPSRRPRARRRRNLRLDGAGFACANKVPMRHIRTLVRTWRKS